MPWVRLDDRFPSHRKVALLSDRAFRLHVSAICWASENLTDGLIPDENLARIAHIRNPKATAQELESRGLWERTAGGWLIHDYLEYNPSRSVVLVERTRNAARQQAFRDRRKEERDAARNGGRNGVTGDDAKQDARTTEAGRAHDGSTTAKVNSAEAELNSQVTAFRNAVSNSAPSRPDPNPSSGSEREKGERSSAFAPDALSLIPSDWQPGFDDIRAAQAARTAGGRPVLTGAELSEVTRKFVRRMTADRREATNWGARWQEWAERERPSDTPAQPSLLMGLDGGAGPLWPHELPQAAPTPEPLQTCPGCERAYRAPEPGRCRDCRATSQTA